MQDLPLELIRHIIHLASLPAYPTASSCPSDPFPLTKSTRRFLASLALVHRSWTPLVENELLRYVYIGPDGPHEALERLLRRRVEERKSGIKSLVFEGRFSCGGSESDTSSDGGAADAGGAGDADRNDCGDSDGGGAGGYGRLYELSMEGDVWKDVRALRLFVADEVARNILERCSNLRLVVLHATTTDFSLIGTFPHLRLLALMQVSAFEVVESLDPRHVPQLDTLVTDQQQQQPQAPAANLPLGSANGSSAVLPVRAWTPNNAPFGAVLAPQPTQPLPTPSSDSSPFLPILPQIKDLTLRAFGLQAAMPFLQAVLDSSRSADGTTSTASLSHLRIETSGASEAWMALSPVLALLDTLETPLKSLHVAYAHLEPLLYRMRCNPSTPFPRCLSRLDYLALSNFLSLSPSATGDVVTGDGYVVRRLDPVEGWADLASLREYLEVFVKARARAAAKEEQKSSVAPSGASGGEMLVELRRIPLGIVGEEGRWCH
ncbi:hypothetical protein JCM6882_005739 [Rhodosporidiobolus microsporus]